MKSHFHRIAVALAPALAGAVLAAPPAEAVDELTVNLVVVGDFHGQIDENTVQFAGTVEQLLAEAPAESSLLVAVGDSVGESADASAAQNDEPAIDVLNTLGVDVSSLGNHELDRGYDNFVERLKTRASFPFLAANVTRADGSRILDASATFTVSGLRVAVVGAVTTETPELLDPAGIEGLTFGEPVPAINAEVERLQGLPEDERPDIVVAAVHEGAPWGTWTLDQAMQDTDVAQIIEGVSPEVDALVLAHGHNNYAFNAPVPGQPDRTRPVIESGYHGSSVGQVRFSVDAASGEVVGAVARTAARTTASDDELIAAHPRLGEVARIRDEAVAFFAKQAQDAADTRAAYDPALVERDAAQAAYDTAKVEYHDAIATRDAANTEALKAKESYEAAITAGKAAYAEAARIKQEYDAAVAAGKAAYAEAARIKQEYDAAVAAGKAAYAEAARIKQEYDAAVAAGKAAYAQAAAVKAEFDTAVAQGMSMSSPEAAALVQRYRDAIAAAEKAYADAAALKPAYDAAVAAGNTAYAKAVGMKPAYDAAVKTGSTAYAKAVAMKPAYDAAVTAGSTAYAKAVAMKPAYDAAISAGNTAYAKATAEKPAYDELVAQATAATAEATRLGEVYHAAMAVLEAAIATVTELKQSLFALACQLHLLCPR